MKKGCGILFKSESGIIICGEKRVDGNCFLCSWCLENILKRIISLEIGEDFCIKVLEDNKMVTRKIQEFYIKEKKRLKNDRKRNKS